MAVASRIRSSLLVLARVAFPLTVAALGSCSGSGASSRVSSSGQTGSPNNDPPPKYDTPTPELPGIGGGSNGETDGGNGGANMLPRPRPTKSHKVGDTLLLGGSALNAIDVSDPLEPKRVARWGNTEQSVGVVSAPSLDRVAVVSFGPREYSSNELPQAPLSSYVTELVVLDLSTSEPVVVTRVELAQGSFVLPASDGFIILSAEPVPGPECGVSVGEIALAGPAYSEVSAARYTWQGSELELGVERNLGLGYFDLSSDLARVFFVHGDEGTVTGVIDALDAETLLPAYTLNVDPELLYRNYAYSVALDERDGLTLVTGDQRVIAYDLATGNEVARLTTPGVPVAINFESGELATVDGGGGVVTISRGDDAPSISFVPRAGSSRLPGYLRPFGDGFIEISATNDEASYLTLTAYGAIDQGVLNATDELVTEIGYRVEIGDFGLARTPWALDSLSGQLVLDRESFVEGEARDQAALSLVSVSEGELHASEFVAAQSSYGVPVFDAGQVYYVSGTGIEAFDQGSDPATPTLEAASSLTLGVVDRWFDIEHAGLVFTKHRNSYGTSALSVTAADGAAQYVDIPHAVDAIIPLDAGHVAVFGLTLPDECADGSEFAECGPNGVALQHNGVSVLSLDADGASLAGSIELSSELGEPPPAGIERDIHWQDLVKLSDERVLLLAAVVDRCDSAAECEILGVEAYTSEFTSGSSSPGCAGEGCEPAPAPVSGTSTSGYRPSQWLVPIDLSNPDNPVVLAPITGGAPAQHYDEIFQDGVVSWLNVAGESGVFAYASEQPRYNAQGNSLLDAHDAPVVRNFVQLLQADASGVAFLDSINVPGRVVAVGGAEWSGSGDAERSAFTLGVGYSEAGEPHQILRRASLKGGYAYVEEELALPFVDYGAHASGEHLALLAPPADVCAAGSAFELSVVDLSHDTLALGAPLVLPAIDGRGWTLDSWTSQATEPGEIYVFGGPAGQARAVVDITTDPPTLLRYETYDWR